MKYILRKQPVVEKRTNAAKTVAVFGIVVKEEDGFILVIQDKPVKGDFRRWKNIDSKNKIPGGKILVNKDTAKELPVKIRGETGISSIHLSKKREPLLVVEEGTHTVLFYLMKYIQGDIILGKNVKFAKFLSPKEIKTKIKNGEFLENHRLALEKYFQDLAS